MRAQQQHRLSLRPDSSVDVDTLISRLATLAQQKAELERTARELRCEVQRLERLVYLDPLTGLGNRRHFDTVAAAELSRAMRNHEALALLICDVDRFKDCNDRYGHEAGDTVLIQIAALLRRFCRRGGDLAARYAGDEFALLLPGVRRDAARSVADRLRAAVGSLSIRHGPRTVRDCVSLSIGGTIFEANEPCPVARLVGAADGALYCAKRAGRNCTAFASCA